MIGRLRGLLTYKQAPHLVVDVGGVGYEVEAPMSTFYVLPPVGDEVTLHTHLVIRDDSHTLFGFARESDRLLFRGLIRVNGVGARLALTILSGVSSEEFVRCVHDQDAAGLTRLPGVGRKTAERLIMEMKDRLATWHVPLSAAGEEARSAAGAGVAAPVAEAVSALVTLGYKPQEASRMVRELNTADLASEEIIRRALQAAAK
ncbi:MAG: Holliday junction branch migration protein RuvA [Gammaproteobacteria bacterium]